MKTIVCEACGKEMTIRFGKKKYCNQCRQERDKDLRMAREAKIKGNWIGIEDPIRYDGICCYQDRNGMFYSRNGNPIDKDEMCKYGKIYKVKQIKHSDEPFDYHYEILSVREDK